MTNHQHRHVHPTSSTSSTGCDACCYQPYVWLHHIDNDSARAPLLQLASSLVSLLASIGVTQGPSHGPVGSWDSDEDFIGNIWTRELSILKYIDMTVPNHSAVHHRCHYGVTSGSHVLMWKQKETVILISVITAILSSLSSFRTAMHDICHGSVHKILRHSSFTIKQWCLTNVDHAFLSSPTSYEQQVHCS